MSLFVLFLLLGAAPPSGQPKEKPFIVSSQVGSVIDSLEARRLKLFTALPGFIEARFYRAGNRIKAVIFYRERPILGKGRILARTLHLDTLAVRRFRDALGKRAVLDLNDWGDPITSAVLRAHLSYGARLFYTPLLSGILVSAALLSGLAQPPWMLEKVGLFLGLGWVWGYRIGMELDQEMALRRARHRRTSRPLPPLYLDLEGLGGTGDRTLREPGRLLIGQLNLSLRLGDPFLRLSFFWRGYQTGSITGRFLGVEAAVKVGTLLGTHLALGGNLGVGKWADFPAVQGAVFLEGRLSLPGSPLALILRGTAPREFTLAQTSAEKPGALDREWELMTGLSLRIL